jgi:hypothetical protein
VIWSSHRHGDVGHRPSYRDDLSRPRNAWRPRFEATASAAAKRSVRQTHMAVMQARVSLAVEQIGCIEETGLLPFLSLFENKNDISLVREVQLIRYRVTSPKIRRRSYGKHESRCPWWS